MLRCVRQSRIPLLASRRYSTAALPSDAFTKSVSRERIQNAVKLMRVLSPNDRHVVESMLRVDHSGEIAANTIYEAQADVFGIQGRGKVTRLILVRCD